MNSFTRFSLEIAAYLLMTGCAVFKDEYYFEPTKSTDVVVATTFRGLPEIALYKLGSTQFTVLMLDRGPTLMIFFSLADGESARLLGKEVQVVSVDDGSTITQAIGNIQATHIIDGRGQSQYTEPTDTLVGATYVRRTTALPRKYQISVDFEKQPPRRFRLILPNVVLSGLEYKQPTVEFIRSVGSAYQGRPP